MIESASTTHIPSTTHIASLSSQLGRDAPVEVRLPQNGRIYIDRPLPFVCLYRPMSKRPDDLTRRLVTTQAAYIIAPEEPSFDPELARLLETLVTAMIGRFGRFLLLEFFEEAEGGEGERNAPLSLQPEFHLCAPDIAGVEDMISELAGALERVTIHDLPAAVHRTHSDAPGPAERMAIHPNIDSRLHYATLEVSPIYRDAELDAIYPFLFEDLRRQIGDALKRAFFRYASASPAFEAPSYLALGRRHFTQAVSVVDEGLARIDESFDFLLQTTPVNSGEAWMAFAESRFRETPVLHYRPLPVDPELLKRRLFALPIEDVEDASLSDLFREKQDELDRKITMLRDRNTRRFFYGSLQIYGEVGYGLLELATSILERLPSGDYDLSSVENLDAEAFAEVAVVELNHYRRDCDEIPDTVQIRRDMPPGLMVSCGRLLIGHNTRVPAPRIDALLHHEIGTHMLTYYNGRVQPLRMLYNGCAGYESLQEGIAVLAEYLCGGLSIQRLRVLAARVVAAHGLIEGRTFPELYALLRSEYGFGEYEAYSVTLRTFRGGGLIKDVVYLRGLYEVTEYLKSGGDLDMLFQGKFALHHLTLLAELQDRGILRHTPLYPRYLEEEDARERLAELREGRSIVDLIERTLV